MRASVCSLLRACLRSRLSVFVSACCVCVLACFRTSGVTACVRVCFYNFVSVCECMRRYLPVCACVSLCAFVRTCVRACE